MRMKSALTLLVIVIVYALVASVVPADAEASGAGTTAFIDLDSVPVAGLVLVVGGSALVLSGSMLLGLTRRN